MSVIVDLYVDVHVDVDVHVRLYSYVDMHPWVRS